jgi:hypothetical protein
MDTAPKVQGHHVDLFIADCAEAKQFGRGSVGVTLINGHDWLRLLLQQRQRNPQSRP